MLVRADGSKHKVAGERALALRGGERVTFEALCAAHFFVPSGAEIREPVLADGPFIMNERSQIDCRRPVLPRKYGPSRAALGELSGRVLLRRGLTFAWRRAWTMDPPAGIRPDCAQRTAEVDVKLPLRIASVDVAILGIPVVLATTHA